VPPGSYLVNSALQITKGTIEGAGAWYSQIETNELIDNTSAVGGPINLSGFAILGNTADSRSRVSGAWTRCGFRVVCAARFVEFAEDVFESDPCQRPHDRFGPRFEPFHAGP
jgi:hypothetical protein